MDPPLPPVVTAPLRIFKGHVGHVTALAGFGDRLFSAAYDNTIREWDLPSGRCVRVLEGHTQQVLALALLSADGADGQTEHRLLSGSLDTTVKEWDLRTGACLRTYADPGSAVRAVATIDGSFFSACDNVVKEWDPLSGRAVRALQGHSGWVRALATDGTSVWSGAYDKTIKEWDLTAGRSRQTLAGHEGRVMALALTHDGNPMLLSGSEDRKIQLWDLEEGQAVRQYRDHSAHVYALATTPGRIFSGSQDRTVKEFEHPPPSGVVVGPTGALASTAGKAPTASRTFTNGPQGGWVRCMHLSPETHRLYTGSSDGSVREWDCTPIKPRKKPRNILNEYL